MIISKLAKIGEEQADFKQGFVLVAAMALGNGVGRIVTGSLSDKLGRRNTLLGCFVLQACLMLILSLVTKDSVLANVGVLVVLSALLGANYGANLAVFPSMSKNYYGVKNFGVNYGLLFTAWGAGGFLVAPACGRLARSLRGVHVCLLHGGRVPWAGGNCHLGRETAVRGQRSRERRLRRDRRRVIPGVPAALRAPMKPIARRLAFASTAAVVFLRIAHYYTG